MFRQNYYTKVEVYGLDNGIDVDDNLIFFEGANLKHSYKSRGIRTIKYQINFLKKKIHKYIKYYISSY